MSKNMARIRIERPGSLIKDDSINLEMQGYSIRVRVKNGIAELYCPGFHPSSGPIFIPEGQDLSILIGATQ